MDTQNEIFQQDLSNQERPGAIFTMQLLMKAPAALPEQEKPHQLMITSKLHAV